MCAPSGGITNEYGPYGRNIKKVNNQPPNSRIDYYDEETGDLLQQRWFGPDGIAIWDRDWDHKDPNNNHYFPHDHSWDFSKKKPRQKPQPPNYLENC